MGQLMYPKYAIIKVFMGLLQSPNHCQFAWAWNNKELQSIKSFTYFYLHFMGNTFSFRENFRHGFGTQDISQRSRGQQLGGSKGVVDITHWHDRVKYSVVHDGIHCYRHRIFGQNLKLKFNCLKFCNRGEVTWCDFHQICIQLFQVLKMESFGFYSDKKKIWL